MFSYYLLSIFLDLKHVNKKKCRFGGLLERIHVLSITFKGEENIGYVINLNYAPSHGTN